MKLEEIIKNPFTSLNYMERLVNNGSPSGFTKRNSTSEKTNPFKSEGFYLKKIDNNFNVYGDLPEELLSLGGLLVHPDMENYISNKKIICDTNIYVVPTSSFRTVKVLDKEYYIKLSYPGVIGRMRRDLEEQHVLSCIQMNQILYSLVQKEETNKLFAFLPEYAGGVTSLGSKIKAGYMVRSSIPIGKNVSNIAYIIPGFSLFGKDIKNPVDMEIINQIMLYKNVGNEYLLTNIIQPLIEFYFDCLLKEGISPEMHSQNILFGFDKEWNVASIILRDLESIDKDVTIRANLDKSNFINSFKNIKESDYNYRIKHSFMFDHKLGEYLVEELITCTKKLNLVQEINLRKAIKDFTVDNYGSYFQNLFPSNSKWYKFDNVEINHDLPYRPYLELDDSTLR